MFPPLQDLYRVAPEIVLCTFGMLVMFLAPLMPRPRHSTLSTIALIGAGLALVSTWLPATHPGLAYSGLFRADAFSLFIHWIVCGVAFLAILGSSDYLQREDMDAGEFCALILFATAGMGVMAGAQELLTAFVGLEMSSISSYILAGYKRDVPRSNEASLKYFLLGSFATAFFLYGIAISYGSTGTTHLDLMDSSSGLPAQMLLTGGIKVGMGLILIGLAFKVAAVPFQMWTPDVYEGAPAPVTALLSTGPKAAAFAVLFRIVGNVGAAGEAWLWIVWVLALLSMTVGNLAAIAQTSLKRMLAYSSIAHAGYILVALAAASATDRPEAGIAAALFYLLSYALVKLGAFLMVAQLGGPNEEHVEIEDVVGLAHRQPAMAACLSVFLLSLLGMPLTVGFLGKFYIFNAALGSSLVWLSVLLAINSVIASYYYLRVIVAMYMREPKKEVAFRPVPSSVSTVLWITAVGTIFVGIFPSHIYNFAAKAAMTLR